MRKKLTIVELIGDGIGRHDFSPALKRLIGAIATVDIRVVEVADYRVKDTGELDPSVLEIFKEHKLAIKGPTRTPIGKGAKSVNVALRQELGLYCNFRPISWLEGVKVPVKRPEDVKVALFRENTEDIYAGIGAKPGSREAKDQLEFLRTKWQVPSSRLPDDWSQAGIDIKIISKKATEKIVEAAMQYALKHSSRSVCIVHKGNIMKNTEGSFLTWGFDYIRSRYADKVYFGDDISLSEDEKQNFIRIDSIISDDALQRALINPLFFDVVVTPNLMGDLLSDQLAAQVGGVPLAAGGNIGDDCAVFEAIGGTADDIAGKDIANPTAYFFAFAMLLEYAGCIREAEAIRAGIASLFREGAGTADMKFDIRLSTSKFTELVSQYVNTNLQVEV